MVELSDIRERVRERYAAAANEATSAGAASGCCSTATLADCCEPAAKADCCREAPSDAAGICGCRD